MPLSAGMVLGSYEVVSPLGAGGMGEVYRARDVRLNRDVALKILPDTFAGDAERLGRFRREAQLLASLNHPNIAQIYGYDEAGPTHVLVMELVDGPTLADRLARGPIAPADAVPIARQIAEALEAAHEQGIGHRDLKPPNIKLRDDGAVKVLHLVLAKARERRPGGSANSLTMRSPAHVGDVSPAGTAIGVILGTAAYMSPEQAKGKAVDKRADIWAFGVVLWEMLTGETLFAGGTL